MITEINENYNILRLTWEFKVYK